jgi:methylated-DNA-protein-cysteine methyltransferase related protein
MREGPEAVYAMVRDIPSGKVTSYGALGLALDHRVSGLVVGNWMSRCPGDLPWWRVTAKDGRLVVFKRDVSFAVTQRNLLEEEGVLFEGDKVKVADHYWEP